MIIASLLKLPRSTVSVSKANVGQNEPRSDPSRLSGPAIAGIALGCFAILALVSSALLLWCRKTRRRQLPPSIASVTHLNMGPPQKGTPIFEEFSSVYRSQSNGRTGEQSAQRCMDLLDGPSRHASVERNNHESYLLMYKTGAIRSAYEATLRPEDSASFHVLSPPASEVGSQPQSDNVTRFTPTISAALPPLSERDSASRDRW